MIQFYKQLDIDCEDTKDYCAIVDGCGLQLWARIVTADPISFSRQVIYRLFDYSEDM